MTSKLPYAKAFNRWLLKEVLPAIRLTGSYTAAQPALGEEHHKVIRDTVPDVLVPLGQQRRTSSTERFARVVELDGCF